MKKTGLWFKKFFCVMAAALMIVSALPQLSLTAKAAGYSIKINRATNVVTVYDADGEPIRAMTCSTGGSNTPLGDYHAGEKYRWQTLDGPCYGQYCTRITGHVLFHSVWYYSHELNSQSTVQYNKLGTSASHGCVRLTVADAKWVYENIPSGTKIHIFSGDEDDDPLGKPRTIQVSTETSMGWDPTDPDPNNPYAAMRPKIDVSRIKAEVAYGKKSNFKSGVRASDSGGGDITADVKVKGKVNTKKLGTYKVVYKVVDALGHSSQKTMKIKVVDTKKATISGIESPMAVAIGEKINLKDGITVKAVDGTDLLKKTEVYVKGPDDDDFKKTKSGSYKFADAGDYIVKYSVTNPHNDKVTTKKLRVEVSDNGAPTIEGYYDEEELLTDDSADLMEDVVATTPDGRDVTSTITITITLPDETTEDLDIVDGRCEYTFEQEGKYIVAYTATDPDTGLSTTKKSIYHVE